MQLPSDATRYLLSAQILRDIQARDIQAQILSDIASLVRPLRLRVDTISVDEPFDVIALSTYAVGRQLLPKGFDTATVDPRSTWQDAQSIISEIDRIVHEDEEFEAGEPRPSSEAIDAAKTLILAAEENGCKFPSAEVSTYYGELDVTWKFKNRLLRLIVYSDPSRSPLAYFQTDTGESFTRGQSLPIGSLHDLVERLSWLVR